MLRNWKEKKNTEALNSQVINVYLADPLWEKFGEF